MLPEVGFRLSWLPKVPAGVKSKSAMPTAWGVVVTRHPVSGAAEQPAVAVRELVETRAAKEKISSAGCCGTPARLTQVNLLIPMA